MLNFLKLKQENEDNKLMYFRIMIKNSEQIKLFRTNKLPKKTEDLININLYSLSVHDDRYIKTKRRTSGDKVYTNFRGLNVPQDGVECESLAIVSINSLLVYENKYYLRV